MLTLATKLTLLRIVAIPGLVALLYFPSPATCAAAFVIFALAALTDMADGLVARQQQQVTNFGKFLDPLADKLLIASVLVMLVRWDWVEAWVAIIIIGRELTVTGLRAMAADQGLVIAADAFGKAKTILQILALGPLIYHYPFMGHDVVGLGTWLLYLALVLTVVSGAKYLISFYRVWRVA